MQQINTSEKVPMKMVFTATEDVNGLVQTT